MIPCGVRKVDANCKTTSGKSSLFSRKPRSKPPLECSHIYELINIDTLDLFGIHDWEETAGRNDTKTARAVMLTYSAEFHEIVNQGAGDKRPQTAAHMDIGFDAVGGAFFESNRMAGARLDPILDIGQKPQHLVRSLMRDRHFHRKERHVLDFYAHFLDGRDENVAVRILARYRREKPHEGGAADRRAAIKPRPVARDPHIDIAAKRRIPLLHRGERSMRRSALGLLHVVAGARGAHGRGYDFNIQRRAAGTGRGPLSAPSNRLFGDNLCPIAMQTSKSFDRSPRRLYS